MLSLVIDIYLSTMKDLCVTDSEYLAFRLNLSIDNLKKWKIVFIHRFKPVLFFI